MKNKMKEENLSSTMPSSTSKDGNVNSNIETEIKTKRKPNKKILIPIVLLLLIATTVGISSYNSNRVKGELEAVIVPNVSEVSGKILETMVDLGQNIQKGDVIAIIENTDQRHIVEQLEISLEQALLALGEAKGGSDTSSGNALLSAQANYNTALSKTSQAQKDYQTAQALYDQGAITADALNKAKLTYTTANDIATASKAQLSNASNEFTKENSELSVAKTQNQLDQAREKLEKYTITAACDGIIISKSFNAGNLMAPGYDIADIACADENYLVAYIPVEKVSDLDYNQTIAFKYDGKNYDGILKYMDVKSEFTPKDLQTNANKSRKTVKIKLLIPAACPMKPGETATVILP